MTDLITYTCKAMTGIDGDVLIKEAYYNKGFLEAHGITVLDPVIVEGVKALNQPLHNSQTQLMDYWARDKAMIRASHVVLDVTGQSASEGKAHEIGYARYCLWKPVVRICPKLGPSVARLEDDFIVGSLKEAVEVMIANWGTVDKRIAWRQSMLDRCFEKWKQHQLEEWK